MAEYQNILRYLFQNPPQREPEKRMHASLLEMLARSLRGEEIKSEEKILKENFKSPRTGRRLH